MRIYLNLHMIKKLNTKINVLWKSSKLSQNGRLPPLPSQVMNKPLKRTVDKNIVGIYWLYCKQRPLKSNYDRQLCMKAEISSLYFESIIPPLPCAKDGTKPVVKSVYRTVPKSLFWAPTSVPRFVSCHNCPNKNAIVNLPIKLKRNSKRVSSNSLCLLGAQKKDVGTTL